MCLSAKCPLKRSARNSRNVRQFPRARNSSIISEKVDNAQCSVENMRRTSMDNNNNNKIKNCKYNIKCNAVIDYIDKNNSPGEDVSQDNSNNKAITTTKIFHVFVSSSFKSLVSF